ncbi:MAG: RsmB/NOP family class I SAM-dependent RNA methyltransferase [Ignavibacteriaceae bacterium]|nr:RsmB/NOP family class I SAM-dependent RNA methyltransferase [Ignavibacteriaceae bacterium]
MEGLGTNVCNYIEYLFGNEAVKSYIDFLNREPVQYIRINTLKTTRERISSFFRSNFGIETENIPGMPAALKVMVKSDIISKSLEHVSGEFYIQGLSSMIPPLILSPNEDDIILDLCASPGSKTTGIGELMNNKGTLLANEIQMDRVRTLIFNVDRMNLVNTGILHFKGELLSKIYNNYFDKLLVDAPCSGLGIIQKRGEVGSWWNLDKCLNLGELQFKLLMSALKMVKEGGEIVYSTCTMSVEENEMVISKILSKFPVEVVDIELPVKSHPGITKYKEETINPQLEKARRILPWEADSDGFFIVKLKKTGTMDPSVPFNFKQGDLKLVNHRSKEVRDILKFLSDTFGIKEEVFSRYKYLKRSNDIFFVSEDWHDDNLSIFERIGTRLGKFDKRDELTFHTQAAQILHKEITNNIYEIKSDDELKKYINGGIIKKEVPLQQYVIKYRDYILGTAVGGSEGIKSRFPRSKRTQGIYLQ